MQIEVKVNGQLGTYEVSPRMLLSDFLRQTLGLTGTHVGCEHGICGACTIIVNGKTARSCLMFAVQTDGAEIETIEGLAKGLDSLHPIQNAFWDNHGLQCGFCTPGFLMTAVELLRQNSSPTREEVREAISGNLCRCTGYETIIDAIMQAAGSEPTAKVG